VRQNPSGSTTEACEVERLGVKLGAEIRGLDLKTPMNEQIFEAFEAALIEHKVLVLRDQHLTTVEHVASLFPVRPHKNL
jgi:taurine dioxygenase